MGGVGYAEKARNYGRGSNEFLWHGVTIAQSSRNAKTRW